MLAVSYSFKRFFLMEIKKNERVFHEYLQQLSWNSHQKITMPRKLYLYIDIIS